MFTVEGIEETVSVEPTTAKRLPDRTGPVAEAANAKAAQGRMDAAPSRPGARAPGRANPANPNPALGQSPAPLLPPEAPLDMPEQDLS